MNELWFVAIGGAMALLGTWLGARVAGRPR